MRSITVILDNGHGNDTPGKRSPLWPSGTQQLFEWKFNRRIVGHIALALTAYENRGIDCTRLVPENYDVPLAERVARANNIVAASRKDGKDTLLISVHGNAGQGTGWEVWTTNGQTQSDKFAEIIAQCATTALTPKFPVRKDMTDGDSDKESNFYILRKTIGPAVLTENLFMDREKDCKYMLSDEGQQAIAKIHVDAIIEYFQQLNK
jgi:N-acetylmuramoyl-L-alanine amidase